MRRMKARRLAARTDKETEAAIRGALHKGDAGMHKIAARFGVGTGTVQRIKAEMQVSHWVNFKKVCTYVKVCR